MIYYINGWREGEKYFFRLIGNLTEQEKSDLLDGNVLKRGNNEFWIEKD